MTAFIVQLVAFTLGFAVGATLHQRFGWKYLWSFPVALATYVIIDAVAGLILFGGI